MTDPYKPNEALSLWQAAAIALAEYACGYEHGRGKDDPVYREVTEGRDGPTAREREHYSSCGDLGHWLLERLGLREPWLNRKSLGQYHNGENMIELGFRCPIAHAPSTLPSAGDICEIWQTGFDAHVFVCLGAGSDAGHLRTANYGAGGMSAALSPGAMIADSPIRRYGDTWLIGKQHPLFLRRVIRLADAVSLVREPPDLTGCRVTGELVDALQATWSE